MAIPWAAAGVGLHVDSLPLLGRVFLGSGAPDAPADLAGHPAVHLGDHHGFSGLLLVFTVLLLARTVPALAPSRLRTLLVSYLAFGFVYGLANAVEDAWLEQVVRRGWSSWRLPDMLWPEASLAWLGLCLLALALALAWLASLQRPRPPSAATTGTRHAPAPGSPSRFARPPG
jgi:hypothetical protein